MSSFSNSHDFLPISRQGALARRATLPHLRLGSGERKLALGLVDFLLLSSALVISVATRTGLLPDYGALLAYSKWFITLAMVWLVVTAVFDAYNLARAASTTYGLYAGAASAAVSSLIYLAIPWLTPPLQNRMQAVVFVFVAMLGISAWRVVYARLFVHPAFQRRALIVGAGKQSQALAAELQKEWASTTANPFRGTGYVLLGLIDDRSKYQGKTLAGMPVLGSCDELVGLARTLDADEIIVAPGELKENGGSMYEALLDCRELGIPVTNLTTLYERLTGRVSVDHDRCDVESVSGHGETALLRSYVLAKRLLDLALALGSLLPVVLLMAAVAVANALASPGPLFFRQQRVGRAGRPFKIIKFRTMIPQAEQLTGAVWAGKEDRRVTPVGRLLRKTHLDELPQVLNVLRGEMSVVGPRPERPEFVGHLSRSIPFYRARHSVLPGISGWAQIHQHYGDSVALAQEKLEYDLFYVKRASLSLDILIILRTIAMMFGLRGR